MVNFVEGRLEQAIANAQRVLNLEPDNFQARSNLTRYLYLSGRAEEARQQAERLKGVESENPDIWLKKAEAFTYLGDDQDVLETFRGTEQAGYFESPLANPLLYHFAAVAALRLGHWVEVNDRATWLTASHRRDYSLSRLSRDYARRSQLYHWDLPIFFHR